MASNLVQQAPSFLSVACTDRFDLFCLFGMAANFLLSVATAWSCEGTTTVDYIRYMWLCLDRIRGSMSTLVGFVEKEMNHRGRKECKVSFFFVIRIKQQ